MSESIQLRLPANTHSQLEIHVPTVDWMNHELPSEFLHLHELICFRLGVRNLHTDGGSHFAPSKSPLKWVYSSGRLGVKTDAF